MRAYRDTEPSMVMISSVSDHRHEIKPEISVIIVCENPADTDLLFDFLIANTNIADRRTKGHSIIDDVEQRPKALSIEEMETELLNRWDKRINELEAVIETNNMTIDELNAEIENMKDSSLDCLMGSAEMRSTIEEQKAIIEGLKATTERLKACIVVHIHNKNNYTRDRKDLLRVCDKRQGLLMAIRKDMANGVQHSRIKRELNTAMEEL